MYAMLDLNKYINIFVSIFCFLGGGVEMVGFGVYIYIYIYIINALNEVYTTHSNRIAVRVEDKYVIQNYI